MGDLGARIGQAIGDALNGAVRAVGAALGGAIDAVGSAFASAGPLVLVGIVAAVILVWLILRR